MSAALSLDDLNHEMPEELIAQHPAPRREDARLLVVDRASSALEDRHITDFPALLKAGDLLVLNDTKVVPARFHLRRGTGGKAEALFLHANGSGDWTVMLRASRLLRPGEILAPVCPSDSPPTFTVLEQLKEGLWLFRPNTSRSVEAILEEIGRAALPPYIHRTAADFALDAADQARYQTVYARVPGAVAAPTAGLHLTEELLQDIRERGVEVTAITLHVGLGTFRMITAACLDQHVMHAEHCTVTDSAADAVNRCRGRGGRVVAVGTTSVRALETAAAASEGDEGLRPFCGQTRLFIRPPYRFRAVDALLTNFHLSKSTLLALVMSFAGVDTIREAYAHAVRARYRFFSYGDAMFLS